MEKLRVVHHFRYVLQFWGLHVDELPIQTNFIKEFVLFIFRLVNWLCLLFFFAFQTSYMVHYWDSLDSNAYFEFTIYLSGGVVSASKYVMIVWNENYLRDLIYLIDENLNERIKLSNRKKLYEDTMILANKVLFGSLFVLSVLPFLVVLLLPMFYVILDLVYGQLSPTSWRFPLQFYLPYDMTTSPQYEITYLTELFYFAVCNLHFSGTNTLLCTLSFHVVAIIRDLGMTINELDDVKYGSDVLVNGNTINARKLKMDRIEICILYHRKIFRIIDLYQSVASSIIFIQYFVSMVLNCLIIFKATRLSDGTSGAFFLQYIPSIVFALITITYSGQIIYDEMQTIVSQLYDIKWYNYDKTANQCIQFMIFRSQKFPYLSGMKIIRSNLESLKNSMSAMLSLYAVLISVDK